MVGEDIRKGGPQAKALYMIGADIEVLKTSEKLTTFRDMKDKNTLLKSRRVSTKADWNMKTDILYVTYYRIVTQILTMWKLNKKWFPRRLHVV